MVKTVTLLNVEYYNEVIKPVMAEWAYLWLQKQHLHGIDRGEAVRYMLEGAAARSDTSTKLNLIDLAITQTKVSLGDLPPEAPLTLGFTRALSAEAREQKTTTLRTLQRQISQTVRSDVDLDLLLNKRLHYLEGAKQAAVQHKSLV